MSKALIILLCLLFCFTTQQTLKPLLLLPTETTQNVAADYAFKFSTDTNVPHSASISLTFPFQYDPRDLISYKGCFFSYGSAPLQQKSCSVNKRTFTIVVGEIHAGQLTIFIKNIKNSIESSMSSHFSMKTLFRDVTVSENLQFGKLPFTKPSIIQTSTGLVYNYENDLIEQGSTWVFKFTLAGTYAINSTIRFVFPEGFISNKVQCNITGIVDATMQTRVFPQLNIYDCLNVKATLTGVQNIILSGIVNPKYQMQMQGLQVQIIQPNNLVILQKISITNQPLIKAKDMNATITIPNNFRNNSLTYIFQINMDSTLVEGDYMELKFAGNWTFFLQDSRFIEGIQSGYKNKARFQASYNWPTSSKVLIKNFSQISKESQTAFYLSLRTPLQPNSYNLQITAFKANNKVVEWYTQNIAINQTTGYIRQMKLHPMNQAIKLPVSQTGPLEITLALRNNLPKTNVLTYGKVVVDITPHIAMPVVAINGVVKCYFYGDIPAKNCTYVVDTLVNPTVTHVVAYTPVDFNFQSSQIPFMVTTQGFITQDDEGLTIDTLVKRYHFHVQFYTDYKHDVNGVEIPTEVIFTQWVADPIPLTGFTCQQVTNQGEEWNHLKCQFTTPNQVLNDGHIHILRLQFTNTGWKSNVGYTSQEVYPDFPCLVYGANVIADPYAKCDLYTYRTNGAYKSQSIVSYVNIYGMQIIPGNSAITFQIPKIKRQNWQYATGLTFTILQDTYGYQTDYIKLYSQSIPLQTSSYVGSYPIAYTPTTQTYTMSNSIVNKVSDLTLTSVDLGTSAVQYIILEVDQIAFPDIGRARMFACGIHKCSKFNKPTQYFILYPQTTLTRFQNLVFPSILNPSKAGLYTFYLRVYKSFTCQIKTSFTITVTPDLLVAPTYTFASYETITQMYPKTRNYYTVSWTLKNKLAEQTSYIEVIFNNIFTLSSTYCQLVTSVQAWDGKQVQCQVWKGGIKVILSNMKQAIVGSTFSITVQMSTSLSTGTVSPTVSIYTYVGDGSKVDQILTSPFTPVSITNTNLQTLSTFDFSKSYEFAGPIKKAYFGDLVLLYDPGMSSYDTSNFVYSMVLTLTPQFYPYSNVLNLPLSCRINSIRYPCSYSLNPFEVTIDGLYNQLSASSSNVINITTEYLERNGIYHPANQGRYLIKARLLNNLGIVLQTSQQYIDIKPASIQNFIMSYAHRDANLDNIYIAELQNGPNVVTAYNNAANASRIYIGFPTVRGNGAGTVFTNNLGFSNGIVVPCYFETGADYITPIGGKKLECRLRVSPNQPLPTYVQIINFDEVAANKKVKVFMAKIRNPATKMIDMNFNLKINYFNPINFEQTPQYQNEYNLFIDMLDSSISTPTYSDTSSLMFQAGSKVGDLNKYINHVPLTLSGSSFVQNDWFIVVMNSEFQLNGVINNCIYNFYKRCIPFNEINWVAILINNGTLIPFYPQIIQMPLSISRDDTYYNCYTWKAERWTQTIKYTISAAERWLQLRGVITGFRFQVLGSQNNLNIGQQDVDVLVGFTVSHKVPAKGTIQIKFPNDPIKVPRIKPHCRSAVTMSSQLYGQKTGKPATNRQGQVGCLVQNTYSWLITSYQQLPAGSQVYITGTIYLPTVLTSTLGTGYIVTYSEQHATNVFTRGRMIDYLSTNFLLEVENKTWNLVEQVSLIRSQPLRISHIGKFQFKLQIQDYIRAINTFHTGYIDVNFWTKTVLGLAGGFSAPSANTVCSITHEITGQKFACMIASISTSNTNFISYRLQFYYEVSANTPYLVTITTQKGDNNQGIPYPSDVGTYKIQTQIMYYTNYTIPLPPQVSKAHFVDVYGPKFNVLNLVSTVSIPGESNLLLFEISPSATISNNVHRLVIQIPTISNDGVNLFQQDLGMGYTNYDDLLFDLYDSTITSMKCKFYIGDRVNSQPVRIICNQYSPTSIPTTSIIRFGFWVKNPSLTSSLAIPIQVYFDQTINNRKFIWQILQAGIKIIPTTVSPVNDFGNFLCDTPFRQVKDTDLKFTNRNTKPLQAGDFYIMKFNFDLRNSDKKTSAFKYPYSSYANSGNAIFLKNCKTIVLEVGATPLGNFIAADAAQSNKLNVLLDNVLFNPATKLTTTQSQITAYAVYLATQQCQKIIHKDAFPTLTPNEPTLPDFTMTAINSNLRKGQYEDYKFSFRVSSNLLTDSGLVKRISIQFPPITTYDFKFRAQTCIEDPSSTIQIKKCYIDTSTYTIWIQPVQKSTYQNSNYLIFQTIGKAIMNPLIKLSGSDRMYLNTFVIKYYTWANDDNPPAIFATSDDYAFIKQDITQIPSTTYLTYTSITNPHHDSASISEQIYVNQFLPLSSDVGTATTRVKTPLRFKFNAMTAFPSKENTAQFHLIRLKFLGIYSFTTSSKNMDLVRFIPICELNGYRILSCTLDGSNGLITMNFQQAIAANQQVSVKFSVLDPIDATNDGFILINTNSPMTTLPIYVTPFGGTNYYIQPQPFPTFYKTSGVSMAYPSMGIVSATLSYGTQVYGKMNYLDFSLQFSRNDINGLVLQIPLVQIDGSNVYSDSKLLNLQSGAEYPCSVGHGMQVFCYYERGQTKTYGKPTRIYITRFVLQTGNTLSFRMLFTNPDVVGVYPSFNFKAFGGAISNAEFMGQEFMGQFKIINAFKTLSAVPAYYNTSTACKAQPNKRLYSTSTKVAFFVNRDVDAGRYVMLEWTLHDTTYGQVSMYTVFNTTNDYDYMIINYAKDNRKLYIIKKFASALNADSTTFHQFGYLRNKHFLVNDAKIYIYFRRPYLIVYTCAVDLTWHRSDRNANQYTATIAYLDLQDRISNRWGWQFLSIDLGVTNPKVLGVNSTDIGQMIVVVGWLANLPYAALSTSTDDCSLQNGIMNTNVLRPITCTVDSANNRFVFRNVNKFNDRYLKFYYFAQTAVADRVNHQLQIRLYANQDSFAVSTWQIFSATTAAFTIDPIFLAVDGSYNRNQTNNPYAAQANSLPGQSIINHDSDDGYAVITAFSTSSITIRVRKGSATMTFDNDVYKLSFRFYVPRLTFTGVCSVLQQPVSRTGRTCTLSGHSIILNYTFYDTTNNNNHFWPEWAASTDYIFQFGLTVSGQLQANYLFVTMAYSWFISSYYQRSSQCGIGCVCSQCPETLTLTGAASKQCITNCGANDTNGVYLYYTNRYCRYWNCRWFWSYGGQVISGKVAPTLINQPINFVSSYYGDLLTYQKDYQTQFMIHFSNFIYNVGPAQQNYILLDLNGQSFSTSGGNPFPYTDATQIAAQIQCKCLVVATGTMSQNSATTYLTPRCVRYLPVGLQASIGISINVNVGQDLRCYFPGFRTTTSNYHNVDVFIEDNNYHHTDIPRMYWARYSMYNQINVAMNTYGLVYGITFDDSYDYVGQNQFWSGAQTTTNRYYDLNFSSPHVQNQAQVYMSMYAPMPVAQFCSSYSFDTCRFYNSFINRRYFFVAKATGNSVSSFRISGNSAFPPSDDALTSFYPTILYTTQRYYESYVSSYSNARTSSPNLPSVLYPSTGAKNVLPSLFGNFLQNYNSSITVSAQFNNKKIYSYARNYGAYRGSFIKVTFTGLTNLKGCSASLKNRPINMDHPFYCQVISISEINIFSRNDLTINDYIYFTVYTAGLPASSTCTIQLFDKFISATDYARSFSVTQTFSRSRGIYTNVDSTQVQFRRPAYKQYQTTAGPVRFTMKNNYEYVSDYNETSFSESPLSDAIVVYMPSGFSSSDGYICYAKQYLPGKRSLNKQFEVPCDYWTYGSGNKVHIKPLPSYTFKPSYFYEFVIYRNFISTSMLITLPVTDVYGMQIITSSQITNQIISHYDYFDFYKFKNVYPSVLNNIYTLTKQAAAINSLHLDFTLNVAGTSFNYLEFQIPSLGLSSFKIDNGDEIPCYSAQFATISLKTQIPRCFGFTNDINTDSPLIIRAFGMAAWTSGVNFKLSFDNFNNPPVQKLFLVPIDIIFRYVDRTNRRSYQSFWPSIYLSDSINMGSPTQIAGSLSRYSNNRGANSYHFINVNWPYYSQGDVSQKMVLKLAGGVTCCQPFVSISLRDNTITYNLLWTNSKANISVYATPIYNVGTVRNIYINNVNNPYPYQRDTYEKLKKIQILFYSSYKAVFSKKLDQFSFSSYTMFNQFTVDTTPALIDSTKTFYFHDEYPVTYRFDFSTSRSQFNNRQLAYTIITFTSGVTGIQWAHARCSFSSNYFNSLIQVIIGKDVNNKYFLKISGMSDSLYQSTGKWNVWARFFTSSNTITYVSQTYAMNGQLQFTNSRTLTISGGTFQTAPYSPTALLLRQQKYFKGYYQLQRIPIYAKAASSASKIQFRFKTPYNITNQQTIDLIISDNTQMLPINTPNDIYCLIRKTITPNLQTGISYWSECTYTAGKYRVTNPIGNMLENTEYTLTIVERNQTTTSFKLPYTPKRIFVSSIYTSQLNLLYGDVYQLDFAGRMNSISFTHVSFVVSNLNMIGVTFNPAFTLVAASLTNPVTQTMLQLQIYSKQFDSCVGAQSLFTTDSAYFASGTYYSHFSSPASATQLNANTRLKCGQFSQSYAPIKLTTTDYGQISSGSPYYFRYPLIKNPSLKNIPFLYKFRLLEYKTDTHFPVVIGSYQYQGLQYTQDGITDGQTGSISISNNWVQSTITLSYTWPNYNQGIGTQTWIKFKNDQIQALTEISSLKTISTPNYNYQYYPNINLCVFIKTTSINDRTVDLGSFVSNDDIRAVKTSWSHLLQTSKIRRQSQGALSYWTGEKTSWDSSTFSHVSGLKSTNSENIFRVTFMSSSLKFVQGSYMKVTFISGPFIVMDQYCRSMAGFVQGTTLTSSNLVCKRVSNTQLIVQGYQSIGVGTTLSFDIYLKVNINTVYTQTNCRVYIQVFSKDDKAIIRAYTNYLSSYTIVQGAQVLQVQNAMRYKFMKDTSRQIYLQFKLTSNSLGQNDYVQINFGSWTLDTALTGIVIAKYKVGSNYYWTPAIFTLVSGNKYRFGIYKNISTYTIPAGSLVTLRINHINPDNYYGILVPDTKWNYLKITAHSSLGTVLQHQYAQIWTQPYEHLSLNVIPALDYVDAVSIYQFTVTPNVSTSIGDYILIEFTIGDGLYSDLFPQDLGKTIPVDDSLEISCRQTSNAMIISNNNIKCQLFKGDLSVTPTSPVTVQIKVQKAIPANQLISINILSLKNPARSSYPIGVTFKLANICIQSDQNRLCPYYKSTKYIYFKAQPFIPFTVLNYGSLTFSPNYVSAANSEHTITAGVGLAVGDYVKVVYYNQVIVKDTCALTVANGICYAYPLQNTIIIKATLAQAGSYSFTLTAMTNLYQYSGSKLYTQVWQASTKTIIKLFYTSYTVPVIVNDPVTNNPLAITFAPTLTPDYQLSYNFRNIAKIKVSYIMQNKNIQQIYLAAPAGIWIFSDYCNATLESDTTQAKPYPFRFKCQVLGSLKHVRITKQSDFPTWNPQFINKKVVIYLKYTIDVGLIGTQCTDWIATTYTHPTSISSDLRVSEAKGNFFVQLYQSPYIYKVDFFTYSFTKRICQAGQLCMFYGYLLPSTSLGAFQIKYMDYTIPSEFQYSNLKQYNACDMKQQNSDSYTFGCLASRNNSKVTVRLMPPGGYSYNHNYKLLKIDHVDYTKLFTAPQYPGTHYQMKVDLYTTTDKLIQSQYVNLTTVYGKLLSWSDIQINIPKDAQTQGVFQFTFKVGAVNVQPAYQSSPTNKVTSAIQVIFSNSFQYDLGTGKTTGEQVACLPILNLNLKTMGKLTCKIYPSYSTITNPTIIITGYDKILSGLTVSFKVAGLKSLPVLISDYIKIGVSYMYYDYGNVKGYIYEPTGKVVGPVTAKAALKSITVSLTQTSSNFVGQLVNYYFTCNFAANFAQIKTTDYIGVQFPQNGFQGRFSMNQKAKCSLSSGEACQSYGLANIIYFKPSAAVTSTTITFSLRDIINSAYSFDYKPMPINIFSVIDGKIDSSGIGSIVKFSKPSVNISGLITKTDSNYGGQSDIMYYFDFKLGTFLPQYGKISITFPKVYSSLFNLSSTCNFTTQTIRRIGQFTTCEIVDSHQIIISPNGIMMQKDYTYGLVISNLTNPNQNITTSKFKIQSFYTSDIYNMLIVSSNVFSAPEINLLSVKSCQFDLTIQTKNQNYKSFYSMALICPSVIKQSSRLQVYLPWNLTQSLKQLCTTETGSLYSYECSIKNEYINNKLVSFMEIYLREHVPQKLISIKGEITNGIKGVYSLNASISYKSFTYLSGISNKIYIQDTAVKNLKKLYIKVQNYPYNRNYQSLYTFKITNPRIQANSLRIQVPSVISQGVNGITCNSQLSTTNKDYFLFLTLLNTTTLTCSMSGRSILINGLSSIISSLKDDQFLFLDVFGLKNPDLSVDSQQFKITFINMTDQTGSIIGSMSQRLAYKVSQAPLNLQINSISLTSRKFQVITYYTLTSSTIAGSVINVNAESQIGVKINFPKQYSAIWSITSKPSAIKINLGSTLYTSSNIYMVEGKLMARFSVNSYESFTEIKVSFQFRNPAQQINCTISTFIVSLFDFKQNSIIAETVGNNVACLELSDRLYWIRVSGNSQIRSGNFSTYTIQIQKPAKYLKITPKTTTSAITFSPSEIIFSNYSSTIQKFKIISSPAFVGNFLVTFKKQQQLLDLFYNDIKNQTVSLVAPIMPYLINFEQISSKSIGQPIETFITLQVPSTVAFALLHTNNCSNSYEILPQGRILIPAGQTQVAFSVRYKGNIVPYTCSLKFQISSLININYALATNVLYMSGQPSIDRTNSLRPMILRISKSRKDSKDIGTFILTSDIKSALKPIIYELKDKKIKANQLQLQISSSQPGFVYYAAMEVGTQTDKITQQMIFKQNIKTGIQYNKTRAVISSIGSVNILADLFLSGLESDKRYLIGVYLNSTVGISQIKFKQAQTLKSQNGAVIKICFNAIQNNSTVLQTLSTILRLKTDRLFVFTLAQVLNSALTTYQTQVMNSRRYVYEIGLGPNRFDSSISPLQSFNQLVASKDLQNKVKELVPSFDTTYVMNTHELILAKPKIRGNGISVQQLTHYSVKVTVQFWEVAYVYGVIIPADKTKPSLLTKQIIQGLDRGNSRLDMTHRVATQTNAKGVAQLQFKLLEQLTQYEIFVTAECVLPYNPRAQLSDAQVLKKTVKTSTNLNVANNGPKILEYLKQLKNDQLAEAVREHLLSVQQKKALNVKVTRIRKKK